MRALARAATLIEAQTEAGRELIAGLFPNTGRALLVGITGPPGAGKSTLVDQLAKALRRSGQTVGIIAVDPSEQAALAGNFVPTTEGRMVRTERYKYCVYSCGQQRESLVDYDSLLLARELGYSGIALKACKGQSESLLLAAAGQKFGMFLCVQDLTCPGFSFLHSAALAARIPGVAAIEGNGRQYCPAANRRWRAQYPPMFDIKDGTVGTSVLNGVGLGF